MPRLPRRETTTDIGKASPRDRTGMNVKEAEDGRRGDEVRMKSEAIEEGLEGIDALGDGGFVCHVKPDALLWEGGQRDVLNTIHPYIAYDLLIEGFKV